MEGGRLAYLADSLIKYVMYLSINPPKTEAGGQRLFGHYTSRDTPKQHFYGYYPVVVGDGLS